MWWSKRSVPNEFLPKSLLQSWSSFKTYLTDCEPSTPFPTASILKLIPIKEFPWGSGRFWKKLLILSFNVLSNVSIFCWVFFKTICFLCFFSAYEFSTKPLFWWNLLHCTLQELSNLIQFLYKPYLLPHCCLNYLSKLVNFYPPRKDLRGKRN